MKTLSKTQYLYISNDLKSKGLSKGFRVELLDHICCLVESDMNNGADFSSAYAQALEVFGNEGFEELKQTSAIVKKQRWHTVNRILISGIAACVFMMVFGVDAQEPPTISPLDHYKRITSNFGERYNPMKGKRDFHKGIDFAAPSGTPVKSTAAGTVIFAESKFSGYGKNIKIEHSDGFVTKYAHLSEIRVQKGDLVTLGQVIGLSGNTGASTAPHLHYEVLKDGAYVDPLNYFAIQGQ
ncbi:M23 family metallopeptidase [Reichenbachiella carrageenanivorans]|uniref:M23 family metallopeptidase n=1 Tax=Reichenbachiella carrageenanivorans TaxID=2979869 RepID=A0ABY6D193_9BACT|nr:M23 family metallopeptidase [Reichenbachiella carrageenanivorans]UXX79937.1 M23 family metallopeptidase [Reichenbachiella carrageenanivorans]